MKQRYLFALVAVALLFAGCGTTTVNPSAVIDFNGLDWQVGPDRDMTWDEAHAWVDGLGGNWRMPTQDELWGLWDAGISADGWGPFENSGLRVWSGEVRVSSSAWFLYFDVCRGYWSQRGFPLCRAFAVRPRSDTAHANATEEQSETVTPGNDGFDFNGLYWQVGPDENTNWDQAKEWVDGLGGNWRMPTRAELQGLSDACISRDNWGPFENSGYWVWSGELRDSSSAWHFDFYDGCEYWYGRSASDGLRAFAVRSQ